MSGTSSGNSSIGQKSNLTNSIVANTKMIWLPILYVLQYGALYPSVIFCSNMLFPDYNLPSVLSISIPALIALISTFFIAKRVISDVESTSEILEALLVKLGEQRPTGDENRLSKRPITLEKSEFSQEQNEFFELLAPAGGQGEFIKAIPDSYYRRRHSGFIL